MKKLWGRFGLEIFLENREQWAICRTRTDQNRIGEIVANAISSGKAVMNGQSYFLAQEELGEEYANPQEELNFDYRDEQRLRSFEFPILDRPYNRAEVVRKCTAEKHISGIVGVELCDIIENDKEWLQYQLNEKLTGNIMLYNMDYNVVGHKENELFLFVEATIYDGDISYDPQADEFDNEPLAEEFYFRSTINPFGLAYFAKQSGPDYMVTVADDKRSKTWYTKTEMIRNIRKGVFVLFDRMTYSKK